MKTMVQIIIIRNRQIGGLKNKNRGREIIIIIIIIITKTCKIVDFAVPADHRIKLKECERLENWKNYGTWRWQLYQLWLALLAE